MLPAWRGVCSGWLVSHVCERMFCCPSSSRDWGTRAVYTSGQKAGPRGSGWQIWTLPRCGTKWAPQSKALKWDWLLGPRLLSLHPLMASATPTPRSACKLEASCSTQTYSRLSQRLAAWDPLFLRVLFSWDSPEGPEMPFSSPPALHILYLCSVLIKAPDFLSSVPRLSLWNPISGLILLCLGSVPLSLSFLLLRFPSLWPPFLSQSCLFAQVCVCAHVCASKRPLPLHQSSKRGSSSSQKEPRITHKLPTDSMFLIYIFPAIDREIFMAPTR